MVTDEFGYPGIEHYHWEEMLEIQSFVAVAFRCFDYTWQHPRVTSYLERVEAKIKRPVKTRHQLPFKYYKALAKFLASELVEREAKTACEERGDIDAWIAYRTMVLGVRPELQEGEGNAKTL